MLDDFLEEQRRRSGKGGKGEHSLNTHRGGRQDTGETHEGNSQKAGKRTKGGSKHRDNTRGDKTIKIKQEVETKTKLTLTKRHYTN